MSKKTLLLYLGALLTPSVTFASGQHNLNLNYVYHKPLETGHEAVHGVEAGYTLHLTHSFGAMVGFEYYFEKEGSLMAVPVGVVGFIPVNKKIHVGVNAGIDLTIEKHHEKTTVRFPGAVGGGLEVQLMVSHSLALNLGTNYKYDLEHKSNALLLKAGVGFYF